MKDHKQDAPGRSGLGLVIFFAGFILSLLFGWVAFPNLLFSQKSQPFNFSHVAHQDSSCDDCHFFLKDGSYSGIPRMIKCKECHESPMGSTEDERILVEEYVAKDREIPWRQYSWQPDNVYFNHASHKGKVECLVCHRDVTKEQKLPAYRENRITGYSMTTIKMETCEKCHAEKGGNNACEACHK